MIKKVIKNDQKSFDQFRTLDIKSNKIKNSDQILKNKLELDSKFSNFYRH